jgi:large subunit ribosomal protein L9
MQKIEVLLMQDHKTLGKKFQVVRVAPVYARNVLLPQGIVKIADRWVLHDMKAKINSHQKQQQSLIEKLRSMIEDIKNNGYAITVEANEKNKLYGHIDSKWLAKDLSAKYNFDCDFHRFGSLNLSEVWMHTVEVDWIWLQSSFEITIEKK